VFRGSAAAAQHQTFSARFHVPDVGRCACYATPRLRQRDTSGLPAFQHHRLQSVLNTAARLIHRSPRYEHITPLVRDLHWLRSLERIDFKLAVLVYRCLHGLAPHYLSDYFQHVAYSNRRRLCSSSSSLLLIRGTRLITVGDRAFPVAGSSLWNSLPHVVTSARTLAVFRKRLKLIFSLVRSHCNWHTMYWHTV